VYLVRLWGRIETTIVGAALLISTLAAFSAVLLRFIFHVTLWEMFPAEHYPFLFCVLLGAAIASRMKLHIRIEVVDSILRSRPVLSRIVRSIMLGLAFIAACLFTYLSYGFMTWAWDSGQTDTILKWFNLGIVKSLPFVMGLLSSISFGVYWVESVFELRNLARGLQQSD